MPDHQQLTLNVKQDSLNDINQLAAKLDTSPAGVISQALALFRVAQGRKIILRDENTNDQLEIDKYSHQPQHRKP